MSNTAQQQIIRREESELEHLSQEALQILEILDKIENHTAELRKKLMAELKQDNKSLRLKLDQV